MIAPVGAMYQGGTLSGNPLAMSAGIAALDLLQTPGTWERLEKASADLMSGIDAAAESAGIPLQQTRVGTMFTNFFSEVPPINWSTVTQRDKVRFGQFFRAILENGIYLAPSAFEVGFMSTAYTDADIQATVAAAEKVFKTM